MLHRYLILLLVIFVLSGCATQSKITYKYSNPNIPAENAETQWLIVKGECLQESNKVPLPIRTPCLGSGYAKGYCEGEQSRLLREAKEVQQQIFDGCVTKKGYIKEVVQSNN